MRIADKSDLGKKRRFLLSGAVTKVHALWMSQWYIVTLGVLTAVTNLLGDEAGAKETLVALSRS